MGSLTVVLVLVTSQYVALSSVPMAGSPCSVERRVDDVTTCLLKVKGQLFNNTAHWFGLGYRRSCSGGPASDDVMCARPRMAEGASTIAHSLFPSRLDLHLIDRYLEVKYSHGVGSYHGCGMDVAVPRFEMDLDPLAGARVTAWNTRHMPQLRFNASDDEIFTVIFYDVGYMRPLAVYVNVKGNNVVEGDVLLPYSGPDNPFPRRNPYIFLVFKQQSNCTVSKSLLDKINSKTETRFTITEFAKKHSLSGPVALNWMSVEGDMYSAELAARKQWLYTCPLFLGQAISLQDNIPDFLPSSMELLVGINVRVFSPEFSYELCGQMFNYKSSNWTIPPFSKSSELSGYLRRDADLVITLRKVGAFGRSQDFKDNLYTLVLVDAEAVVNNNSEPALRLLIVNIYVKYGEVTNGNVVVPYTGVTVHNTSLEHRHYFLLYSQPGAMSSQANVYDIYTNPDPCNLAEIMHCHFDINQMVTENSLTLVGVSFFTVARDTYMDFLSLSTSNNTNVTMDFCCGRPEFADFCKPVPSIMTSAVQLNSSACSIHLGLAMTCVHLINIWVFYRNASLTRSGRFIVSFQ